MLKGRWDHCTSVGGTLSEVRGIFDEWVRDIEISVSALFGMGWDNDGSGGDEYTRTLGTF
jgi:hypothetical protein